MSELLEYKCPACGGALEFDSATQKMKCPFCESTFEMSEVARIDDELNQQPQQTAASQGWEMPSNQWSVGETDGMNVYTCKSCGGEIVGDSTTAATECPFCGNQVVMTGQFQGALKPDYIIPFKLDKNAAKEKYSEHIKGKVLLPKLFKEQNHIDEIKGVYVPFWLYDSNVAANATYEAENVRHWSDSNYDYTERSLFYVHREGTMQFNNIPCDGSTKMDDDLMESIEPFDFSEAVPFQSAYLAGYFADKYDVDENESSTRANDRILQSTVDVLKDTFRANYTTVHDPITQKSDVPVDDTTLFNLGLGANYRPTATMDVISGTVKYALYPVWLLTSTYKGEKFTFAMNGQTGKFVGNLPVDKGKKNAIFASSFAAISAIATALIYLFLG